MNHTPVPSAASRPHTFSRIHVLLPGTVAPRWKKGGALIAIRLAELLNERTPASVVTCIDREPGLPYLDDVERQVGPNDLFIVTWGPHVADLMRRLQGKLVVYYAQSTGWNIQPPVNVPILCLSRFIMADWMARAPFNPIFLLPPVVDDACTDLGRARDIDVLFVERKSTDYLRDHLIPALRSRCHVHTVRDFISRDELFALFNRSRVYLYSSAPWASGWVEGFGLQPLEALLCGCTVYSNLHGGLSDYLEPELNAFKLEVHSLEYDATRIRASVHTKSREPAGANSAALQATYSMKAFGERIDAILPTIATLFAYAAVASSDLLQRSDSLPVPIWKRLVDRTARTFTRLAPSPRV